MKRIGLISVLLTLIFSACNLSNPQEKYIRGTWQASGAIDETHAWLLEWTFKDGPSKGSFEVQGYPPLHQIGNYEIVSSDDESITLKLTNQQGDWPTDDRELTILIDTTNETLTIDNQGPFTRTEQ